MANLQQAGPFLRWAGSKRWLVSEIVARTPRTFGTYFEPFLGSGAAFFALRPQNGAILSDAIPGLIQCYESVRDDPDQVFDGLSGWAVDRETYYRVRSLISEDKFQKAAQFIYLNKTAFNGLYRVNQSGAFNVPFGRPKNSRITTREELGAASASLMSADLRAGDFETMLLEAKARDLIYLDPPYVAGHRMNGFVDYNSRLFRWEDQVRLRNVFERLDALGAFVILSNASHSSVAELYRGYPFQVHSRYSSMAASMASRGVSTELLVIGKTLERKLSE